MSLILLDDAPLGDGVLRRAGVDQLQQAREIRLQARERAARILRNARRKRDEAHRKADAIVQAACAQATKDAEAISEQARAQAVSDAVEWLVALTDLERNVAQLLEARLRDLIAQAVSAVLGECEPGTLLAQRIASRMSQMDLAEPVELHIDASAVAPVSALFAGRPGVSIVVDPALGEHRAVLRTGLMAVRFDLRQHLDRVLANLRLQLPTEGD